MTTLLIATIIGTSIGISGTGLGGIISYLIKDPTSQTQSSMLFFSGGVMFSMVAFSMVPEAYIQGGIFAVVTGLSLSVPFVLLLSITLDNARIQKSLSIKTDTTALRLRRMSLMLISSIGLHNLPEGIAIGSSIAAGSSYSLALILLMLMHDIPEGMSVGMGMRISDMGAIKGVGACALSGLPTGLGAAFGAMAVSLSSKWIGVSLAFAAGAMIAIIITELMPSANRLCGRFGARKWIVIGAVVGLILIRVV